MLRLLDFTFKPYPAPVGNGDAVIRPAYGWRPGLPILEEPTGKGRSVAQVLGYYKVVHVMSGVQPGEIFSKGILTTKPYTTRATFHRPQAPGAWEPQSLAELPARHLIGRLTVADLGGVSPGSAITAAMLEEACGGAPRTPVLFLRTGYSAGRPARPDDDYLAGSPCLSEEAARWLARSGIRVVGADVPSLDPRFTGREALDVHAILNGAGIVVVEDLAALDAIGPQHTHAFVGIPLPVRYATGGPARVFAVDLRHPTDFVDCTFPLDVYPDPLPTSPVPFEPPLTRRALDELGDYPNPLPGRIEPREEQGKTQRATRLTPFRLLREDGGEMAMEMYIEYGHGTGTHIEAAFFDPWGRHAVPEAVLRRYVRIPADRLVGPAKLLDLSAAVGPLQQIDAMHLEEADPGLRPGDIAILRADITDWYFYGSSPGNTPGLAPDAARYLVDRGIRALVLDFAVERTDPIPANAGAIKYTPNKIHYFLHKNDIPIVEWAVDLKNIRKPELVMAICALPASHQGGFPAQVLAVEEWG